MPEKKNSQQATKNLNSRKNILKQFKILNDSAPDCKHVDTKTGTAKVKIFLCL